MLSSRYAWMFCFNRKAVARSLLAVQALCSTSILAVPAQQVSLASKAITLLVFAINSDTDLTDSTSCNATLLNSQVRGL